MELIFCELRKKDILLGVPSMGVDSQLEGGALRRRDEAPWGLYHGDIDSGGPFLALLDIKCYLVAFFKCLESGAVDA